MPRAEIPEGAVKAAAREITPTPAGLRSPELHESLVRFGLRAALPLLYTHWLEQLKEELPDEAVETVAQRLAASEGDDLESYERYLAKHGREDEGFRAQARELLLTALASIPIEEGGE